VTRCSSLPLLFACGQSRVDLRQTVLDYVDALNAANLATKVRS
jgi:hypothetical protein